MTRQTPTPLTPAAAEAISRPVDWASALPPRTIYVRMFHDTIAQTYQQLLRDKPDDVPASALINIIASRLQASPATVRNVLIARGLYHPRKYKPRKTSAAAKAARANH